MKPQVCLIWLTRLALATSLPAQGVLGTWTASGQSGTVTLTLRSSGGNTINGTLAAKGTSYRLQGQLQKDTFIGEASGGGLRSYVEAMAQGGSLVLVLADYGPGGAPDTAGARQIMFTRVSEGSLPPPSPGPAAGDPVGKPSAKKTAAEKAGGPGSIGRTAQDQQLAQLILGSRWCHFSYNQRTGASYRETVTLSRDGILTVANGTDTYSSGYAGTVAGSYKGGKRYYWRIQGGLLHLSQDGLTWAPQPGSMQLNSAGQPIIKSDGKEYSRCN